MTSPQDDQDPDVIVAQSFLLGCLFGAVVVVLMAAVCWGTW